MEGSQGFLGFKLEPEILSEDFSYFSWWRTLCSEHRGEVPGSSPFRTVSAGWYGTPRFSSCCAQFAQRSLEMRAHKEPGPCDLRSLSQVSGFEWRCVAEESKQAPPLYLLVGVGKGSKSRMAAAALGEPETMMGSLRRTWVSGIGSSHLREPSAGAW